MKENEWYLYGFDTVKIKLNSTLMIPSFLVQQYQLMLSNSSYFINLFDSEFRSTLILEDLPTIRNLFN